MAGNVVWDAGVNALTGEDEPDTTYDSDALSALGTHAGTELKKARAMGNTFDYPGQEKDLDGFDTPHINVRNTNDELWAYNESKRVTSKDIKSIQRDIQYYIKQYDKAETDDDREGWRSAIESGKKELQDLMQKRGRNESVNEEKLNEGGKFRLSANADLMWHGNDIVIISGRHRVVLSRKELGNIIAAAKRHRLT